MIRLADYVIERLVAEGVKHLPLITGRGILYLSDAVAKNKDIKPIPVLHEQAGAYAAVAYAQYNDHLGACLVSTGCASTNVATAVLNAWQDGVPCFFLSGQNKLKETVGYTGMNIRTYGSQEANILPIISPITKYSVMIKDPSQIGVEMDKAIYYATHGVKGPVWMDIPVDVQNMRVEPDKLERWTASEDMLTASEADMQYVIENLSTSKRPIILLGSGVRSAGAVELFREFMTRFTIPVVFATSAVDTYGTGYPHSIGAVSAVGGTRAGNMAIQNADLILCIGNRLSPLTTGSQYEKFGRNAKLIVVDINKDEHEKHTVRIDKLILADAGDFIKQLGSGAPLPAVPQEWIDKCDHWKQAFLKCEDKYKESERADIYNIADTLSRVAGDDAVILSDAGIEELIVPTTFNFFGNQRCLHPASQGCMGVALPAAMGAYYACGHPVTAVIGDGSVMMNIQELQTIAFNKMPIRIVIVNNGFYNVIRKRQIELFRNRTIGTWTEDGVGCPDFSKIATCFGLKYMRIEESKDLEEKLIELEQINEPIICEVMAVDNQEYFRTSGTFNAQRRFVMRPIEDLYPWMDRDTFVNEMVIDPIDL